MPVRIAGSQAQLPDPVKVPELMDEFAAWLRDVQAHPALVAIDAHLKFVIIHPYVDGNGRTARLLMNLLLVQEGYPMAVVDPVDRVAYVGAIEKAQCEGDEDDYQQFMLAAVQQGLDRYLEAARKTV